MPGKKFGERFGWIEASLRFAGCFGVPEKKAYRGRFGLTDGMVSRDQEAFRRQFNAQCGRPVIVKRCGRLEPAADAPLPATPMFLMPNVTRWLEEALGGRFEAVTPIRRMEPRPDVLQAVVRALVARRSLWLEYRPRRGEKGVRIVSPHTMVHTAGRLHLRGWDHARNEPRDFVLVRMLAAGVSEGSPAYVGPEYDRDWAEHVILEIRPRDGEDVSALQTDYSLDEFGVATRRVRRAHMRYLIDEDAPETDPAFRSPVTVRQRRPDT